MFLLSFAEEMFISTRRSIQPAGNWDVTLTLLSLRIESWLWKIDWYTWRTQGGKSNICCVNWKFEFSTLLWWSRCVQLWTTQSTFVEISFFANHCTTQLRRIHCSAVKSSQVGRSSKTSYRMLLFLPKPCHLNFSCRRTLFFCWFTLSTLFLLNLLHSQFKPMHRGSTLEPLEYHDCSDALQLQVHPYAFNAILHCTGVH